VVFRDLSAWQLALLIAFWSAAALLVFSHAERHGSKRATWWGVAAFLATAVVVPLYFVRHWLRRRSASG
jgi:branched-subunit amino acid permease